MYRTMTIILICGLSGIGAIGSSPSGTRELEAETIVLRDKSGRARIRIEAREEGGALIFLDDEGKQVASWSAGKDASSLHLKGREGGGEVVLSANGSIAQIALESTVRDGILLLATSGSLLTIRGEGRDLVNLGAGTGNSGYLELSSKSGEFLSLKPK